MSRFWKTYSDYSSLASPLRLHFDECFADPLKASEERFAWDYWHVPNQYTLHRTPADSYFPEDLFSPFANNLVDWGRKNLGCANISPPWLSYYVEGCPPKLPCRYSSWPWAYVYSLTNWSTKKFQGGETQIFRPEVLDFWNSFNWDQGLERDHIIKLIPAEWNQLTLFDPRLPHGVQEVTGTRDPRDARLVIHGWFIDPQPCVDFSENFENERTKLLLLKNHSGTEQ